MEDSGPESDVLKGVDFFENWPREFFGVDDVGLEFSNKL
jgi:hypothetical protein